MSDSSDDHDFRQQFALRDGTPATIRVMRSDDRNRLAAAFGRLDPQSIYTRFFGFRKEIPERAFDRLASIDFVHLTGLVATIGAGADETVIGAATYVGNDAPVDTLAAEVAFTIEEDYHGQGVAGRLFAALADIARRHGIFRFEADVLVGNAGALRVFERSGLPMRKRSEAGVIHIVLDLGPGSTIRTMA
jgi:RimJ/RimL family protein N-acetyltransferase